MAVYTCRHGQGLCTARALPSLNFKHSHFTFCEVQWAMSHLCIVCCHFIVTSLMSLLQGYVSCRKFTPNGDLMTTVSQLSSY